MSINLSIQSPEEQLLVLLSFHQFEEAERQQILQLLEKPLDWQRLFELSMINATAPLVYYNLTKLEQLERVPKTTKKQFEQQVEKINKANSARLVEIKILLSEFEKANIPCVLLKGVLFGEILYNNHCYKKMNDLDILIRFSDLDKIYEIYRRLNYFSAAELFGGKEKDPRKQEKFSHHCPPFFSNNLNCMIGTHWGLITPMAPYTIDYDAIWSRVEDIKFEAISAQSMSAIDNLHHLCVHLPYYKAGIRELADIYNLIRDQRENIDWNLLLQEVRKAKSENLMYHALHLVNCLVPMPEIEQFIEKIDADISSYYKNDTAKKISNPSRFLRSRSVHMSVIEKAYSDFTATKNPKEMATAYGKMLKNIFCVPDNDVVKMNSLDSTEDITLAKRAYTPWRIFKVFSRDLGGGIFIALMIKCFVDIIKQNLLKLIGKGENEQDLANFAAKLGVSLEQLEQLKANLE